MSVALNETLYRAQSLYEEGLRQDDAEKLREAVSLCEVVLDLDPDISDAWQIAGLARLALSMDEAALEAFQRAADLAPGDAGNHVNLATARLRLGNPNAALESLYRAIELQEDLPEAYYNLGNTLIDVDRLTEAETAFRKAISLKPDYPEALNNLGQILRDREDRDGAVRLFEEALKYDKAYVPSWTNLCAVLTDAGKVADAIEAGRRGVLLKPDSSDAQYNLGNAFAAARIPGEAASCYRRALSVDPENAAIHVNLGVMEQDLGNIDGALLAYDHALAHEPEDARAHWNKALTLLLAGRYEEAWPEYEWRWEALETLRRPDIDAPLWDGAEGDGTILLYCEQAFGDAIQFVRYLSLVRQRGWRIVLECPAKLLRLFSDSQLADEVIAAGTTRPNFDCWLPTMSLPGVFGTTLETVPAGESYLTAREHARNQGQDRLSRDKLNVGIVWQGSLTNKLGLIRTSRLNDFARLRHVDGVALFSLQSQLSKEDAALLETFAIPDIESGNEDFADTAAIVARLDLMISVDTAMVHLAGALGCPVWALIPVYPDWRWMRDRSDSPWYPGLRLFRQHALGEWSPVVNEVARELLNLCRERGKR